MFFSLDKGFFIDLDLGHCNLIFLTKVIVKWKQCLNTLNGGIIHGKENSEKDSSEKNSKKIIELVSKISCNIQFLSESLDELFEIGYNEPNLKSSAKRCQTNIHMCLERTMKQFTEDPELIHYSNIKLLESKYCEFINKVKFKNLNK